MIDNTCENCEYNNKDNIAIYGCNPCNPCGEEGSDISKYEPKEKKRDEKQCY